GQAHAAYGGDEGVLGPAVTGVNYFAQNGGGYVRGYASGAITWTQRHGAFALMGEIRAYYAEHGGVSGAFGWPASPPNHIAAGSGGHVQAFERVAVLTSEAGTWHVQGAIRSAFNQAGGIAGSLGWASGPEECDADGACWQDFVGGRVYSGGVVMPGAIRD